jgi:nicotinamide-nucleotide amidase
MIQTARILAQGDEIVSGATVDTNSAWIAEQLWMRGVRVIGMAAAPDDLELLRLMLLGAGRDCDLLVSGGGLGPTSDDCTAEAVARATDLPLVERAEALAQIEERFRALGRPMTPSNRKQALLPAGCEVLENRVGTAPGFALLLGRARAFFFPGVPRELRVMLDDHLLPWLDGAGARPMMRRRFHVCGVGESVLQDRLRDLELPDGVRIGYKTWLPYNSIVLYGEPSAEGASARFEQSSAAVRAKLGRECFGEDDTTLSSALGAALAERGWTLGLAESCTAGGAAALVTEAAGSSAWFRGAIVAYANDVKHGLLGVPEQVLQEHGAVSEQCASAMAEGVRRALRVDVGLSITGIAGPDGGTPDKPVGTVCFGLGLPDETLSRTIFFGLRGRDRVRSLAAASALEWLRRRLTRERLPSSTHPD